MGVGIRERVAIFLGIGHLKGIFGVTFRIDFFVYKNSRYCGVL